METNFLTYWRPGEGRDREGLATDRHTNTQTDKQAVSVNIADWESLHVNRYFIMLHPNPLTLFLTLQGHIIEI